jgi:hypothetical protein
MTWRVISIDIIGCANSIMAKVDIVGFLYYITRNVI